MAQKFENEAFWNLLAWVTASTWVHQNYKGNIQQIEYLLNTNIQLENWIFWKCIFNVVSQEKRKNLQKLERYKKKVTFLEGSLAESMPWKAV